MKRPAISVLILAIFLPALTAVPAAAETPEAKVAAYHQALLDGDIEAAGGMLSEDLLLYEDGIPETSRERYVGGHLKLDIAFSQGAKRTLENQTSWTEGNTSTICSTYDLKTRYKGKRYHLKTAETMTLKKKDGQWVIVHIHWSNHQLKK